MDKDFKEFELRKELDQLNKVKFPSDQELERVKELQEELQGLKARNYLQDIPDIDYDDKNDKLQDEKQLDQLIESIDVNNADYHTLKTLEDALQLKERRIKVLKKIKQLEQDQFVEEAELEELKKEKNFMQGKKNPDGTIPFRENVYQKKLAEAKTGRERFNLKMIKAQTKLHNAMIKAPPKIAKASMIIGEISRGLGQMGDQLSGYSGYDQPKEKHKTKHKHRSKRKKKRSRDSDSEERPRNDYGFNTKNIFGP